MGIYSLNFFFLHINVNIFAAAATKNYSQSKQPNQQACTYDEPFKQINSLNVFSAYQCKYVCSNNKKLPNPSQHTKQNKTNKQTNKHVFYKINLLPPLINLVSLINVNKYLFYHGCKIRIGKKFLVDPSITNGILNDISDQGW